MTHTNHRQGAYDSLRNDFVVMIMPAKGYNNDENAAPKMREALAIYLRHNAVNAGAIKGGLLVKDTPEEMAAAIAPDTPMLHGVFTSAADVEAVLREFKERDLGLSIIVSGLIPEVREIAARAGVRPHSVEFSLGVMGRTELLCDERIRPITTMCGHGLISASLAKGVVDDVAKGVIDAAAGARRLAEHCVCGIFNLKRAESLIEQAVSGSGTSR